MQLKKIMIYGTFSLFAASASALKPPRLSFDEIQEIGKKIWMNECAGKVDQLVFWNPAEEFPSLGIGHFIWFPDHKKRQFKEAFPEFVAFVSKKNVTVPRWLFNKRQVVACPWNSRTDFEHILAHKKKDELKKFLTETIAYQAEFIVHRFIQSLNTIIQNYPELEKKLTPLLKTPQGIYALIDYVNFKGDGTSMTERYNGQGWGLIQVLERMKLATHDSVHAVQEFVIHAKQLLHERVTHAKAAEERFLLGWNKRLDTYLR